MTYEDLCMIYLDELTEDDLIKGTYPTFEEWYARRYQADAVKFNPNHDLLNWDGVE